MRRTRRRQPPPDLTSLFDVLFIVIFAALIRAAAAQQALAEATAPAPPHPAPVPLDPASLRAKAVKTLDAELAARPTVIVRVSATGTITALESGGRVTPLDAPLLEHSADPDVAMAYLGDRSSELRVCRLVALHLAVPELAHQLVIIEPARPLADLAHALVDGLRRDVERCLADQHGLAVLVDPGVP